jgi:vacuolar-type H+-ATPase subunit E/Vma4
MEELQSTEILDREILEDARKKAHRILKTAEDTINLKSVDWEKTLSAALEELEKKYAQQGELVTDEIMAHLPIDKHRIKAKKIEEMLSSAVKTWYTGLSRDRVLDLLKKELEKRIAVCAAFAGAGKIRVQIHQIERTEAEALLKAVLPGKSGADTSYLIEEIRSASAYPEIILETPEARIYASISKTVELFLAEKRAELVEALLGKMEIAGEAL